jgi:hypothetical protein
LSRKRERERDLGKEDREDKKWKKGRGEWKKE